MDMIEDLTIRTEDFAHNHGADLVKVASTSVLNEKAPKGHRPRDYLPQARSVIVIAIRMFDAALNVLAGVASIVQ